MKELYFAILITVITFSAPGIAASTPTMAGHVDDAKGNTSVIRNGESMALRLNEAVYSSDKIITGDWSRVRLSMNDSDKDNDAGIGVNSEAPPPGVVDKGEKTKPSTIPDITPNALKIHTPKVQAPKIHAPKVQAPKIHAPKVQAPKIHAPKVQAPKIHAPKVQAPKIKPPKP